MNKLSKKKGFTIVELVIVIAVVGVLTAVLVPTFVNLANQARKAENQTFVKNLNTQMAIREATEGKNKTMYEAMMEAEDIGFNVEKLTPFDGNDVVWDSVANRFAIVDKAGKEVYSDGGIKGTGSQLWKIYAEMPETQTYSIYAKEGWEVKEVKNLKVGFDAGKNTGIATVSYIGASSVSGIRESIEGRTPRMASSQSQEVVIRTNGGTLTVNAPADTVKHYGYADSVNVIDIASASYHENGKVALIRVASGRIELEKEADVAGLHINAKVESIAADGTITYSTTKFDNDITLTIGDKEVSLTRDSVGDANIGGDSKLLVCKVETANKSEYVWLDGDGTIENSNVYVSSNANGSDAVAVNSENASDAAKAIANNAVNTGTAESPVYVAVDTGVTINTNEDNEVWAAFDSQLKLEYLINQTSFANLKQAANITDMSSVDIPAGRTVVIDMNGYSIDTALQSEGRHYYAFYNYGELTLQDSSEDETSYIKARGIENLGGKMTINSGKYYNIDTNGGAAVWNENQNVLPNNIQYYICSENFDAEHDSIDAAGLAYLLNEGKVLIDKVDASYTNLGWVNFPSNIDTDNLGYGCYWYVKTADIVTNVAELTINGGEFIVEYVGPIKNGGPGAINSRPGTKLTLNGGNINSACQGCYAVIADGETIVNDITVYGAKGAFAVDSGTCVFNGGTFTSDLFYGCWITNDGADTRVTINGGSFRGTYGIYSSVDDGGQDESNIAITINDGTFEGTSGSAVINAKATQNQFALMIYGGKFSSDPSTYVSTSYTITEDNGWFVVTK